MAKVLVRVTAKDLAEGRFEDWTDCPIARGLKRAFPGSKITVGGCEFLINARCFTFDQISPSLQEASDKIFHRTAKPFWFRVEVK
jgi:hypothetical protein